jgi:hypothetical protein
MASTWPLIASSCVAIDSSIENARCWFSRSAASTSRRFGFCAAAHDRFFANSQHLSEPFEVAPARRRAAGLPVLQGTQRHADLIGQARLCEPLPFP